MKRFEKIFLIFAIIGLPLGWAQASWLSRLPQQASKQGQPHIEIVKPFVAPGGRQALTYFQNGKQISKKDVDQAQPFCSVHLSDEDTQVSPGVQLPVIKRTFYHSYLSSTMIYTRVSPSTVGQIYCEKPTPENYFDRALRFSDQDFENVFGDRMRLTFAG